jgi:hypothetical protein
MTAKIDGTNGLIQQYDYQILTTAFSYTFAAGTTVLVINPAGTLATGTITMPASPVDGMTISFSSTQEITSLTAQGNTGQSIVGNPTSMSAGGATTFVYRLSNTTWYAQINTAVSGGIAPVVNIYTSPATWTKPATVKAVKVTLVSGGGGGGGGKAVSTPFSATVGGGGGGAAGIGNFPSPSVPGPIAVTVGSGGTGGTVPGGGPATYYAGASGGTSSFGALMTATGGGGGTASGGPPTASVAPAPGPGGSITPSPQIFGINGQAGFTGPGGSVAFGFGITPSTGYGVGGTGGSYSGPGSANGTNGLAGFVIVEEFY